MHRVNLTKNQFNAATSTKGAKIIGANEGGVSYKVGRDLLAMIDTGTGFEYTKFPNYF